MILQSVPISIVNTTKILFDKNLILTIGYVSKNWGDALNPILIQKISGKKPLIVTKYTFNIRNRSVYSAIGSVLERANFLNSGHNNLIIWGTGLISDQGKIQVRPKEICAVRGPRTREILLKQGYNCPEIYGDPALLYPRFYKPKCNKKYKLGIIPHYIDKKNQFISNFQNDPDTLIIDICGGINNVIDQICNCQKVASSSLHGIIAADAYGIPAAWIKFSNNVTGSGFKFLDYFESVGRIDDMPFIIQKSSSIDDIFNIFYQYKLDIDLNLLWDVCPFSPVNIEQG